MPHNKTVPPLPCDPGCGTGRLSWDVSVIILTGLMEESSEAAWFTCLVFVYRERDGKGG